MIRDTFYEHYTFEDWTEWTKYTAWNSWVDKTTREEVDNPYENVGYQLLTNEADLGRTEDLMYEISLNFSVFNNIY